MPRSLGLILALSLAGLQFVAIISVVLSSYLTSERVLLDHARKLLSDVAGNTILHSRGFLEPAQSAAELAARLAESRVVSSENTLRLEQLLFEQLRAAVQFAGVYYGDEDGNFVYVMHSEEPGPYRTKIISHESGRRTTNLIWRDQDYRIVETRQDPADLYDPRSRPWYQATRLNFETTWTNPYIFFSSQKPGITIAAPVIRADGSLKGVIGVDIEIDAISDFLANLRIGENGVALIINSNGDVIAHPKPQLLTATDSSGASSFATIDTIDDPVAREAFGVLAAMPFISVPEETFSQFEFEGADYVTTVMPIMSEELPWTIAVYAPEDDFIGTIIQNRTRDIWIAAVIAVFSGIVGLFLASYIARPVRAFAVRAALVSQGELDPSQPLPKTYRELEKANDTLTNEILQRKKSEEEYGKTFDLSSRGMVQIDPKTGRFLRVNSRFAEIVDYDVDELLGMSTMDLTHPDDSVFFPRSGASETGAEIEKRVLRRDGQEILVKVNAIMVRDHMGTPLYAVATIDDITQAKIDAAKIDKLNRDLSHLARGELLGQMAAGLAHELNQPLTAITQNADTALLTASKQEQENAALVPILQDLDQQAHRAADIIKALRNFARKGKDARSAFELADLLNDAMQLVRAELTEHDVAVTVAADDLPLVLGIRVQIAQVLVNLLRNAVEAIVSSGDNRKQIAIEATLLDDFVEVTVQDTGPGVSLDLDLFTQFETTKSNGMGLGLSICRSIVEAGGGKMWHEAVEPHGARFHFTIPIAKDETK